LSNFGQGVAAVAGAVVGFVVGGPTGAAYGFQIGLLAGSALFPTQLPGVTGPRLEDIDQTAAEPGAPVPIPFGTIALAGATIWLGPVVEETETDTVGGKGAPEQDVTTYTYRQSIAIGLCEGPLVSVRRIWENGKLVYDLREQQSGETDDAYLARVETSTEYAAGFDLYLGDEEQLPDPTIEADKGAGNVPAFRGLAYIVYPDRVLRDDQGRRHPSFRFEVSNRPAPVPVLVFEASGTWTNPGGLASVTVTVIGGGGGGAGGSGESSNGFPRSGGGGGGGGISEAMFAADALPSSVAVTVGEGGPGGAGGFDTAEGGDFVVGEPGGAGGVSSFGALLTASGGAGGGPGNNNIEGGAGGAGTIEVGGDGGNGAPSNVSDNPGDPGESTTRAGAGGAGGGTTRAFDLPQVTAAGGNTAVLNGGIGGATCAAPGGCSGGAGAAGQSSEVYEGGAGGGGGGAASGNFGTFDGAGPAVGGGGGDGGLYGGGGAGGGSAQGRTSTNPIATARGGRGGVGGDGVVVVRQTFSSDAYSLADVVEDICHRAGLYEIDVEELRGIPIDGYAVGRPMPARSALEPLRAFGYFDVVESGALLRFRVRGGAAALRLEADDLGAHEPGGEVPPAITTKKLQDVELPRQVRVRYLDTGRDYENGEQLSPVRLTTDAENDIETDLPIAMSGERAAQIAEVLWSDAWRSRWVHSTTIEGRYLELEPTDVLEVPVDGRVQRMRIISIDDDGGALRRVELVRDDDGAYVSFAVAADPDRRPNVITRLQGTELLLLDLPALRDEDNNAGIYAAAYPTGVGTRWDGCVIYRSTDAGQTFASAGSVITPVASGFIASALPDGISSTFDEAVTLTVDLEHGDLESRTEAAVLDGANAAAIGADGRWQIIQFRDVQQLTPSRFVLSGILRGRRGTEFLTPTSRAGDRFVMVSTGALVRLPLENAEIGSERVYRGVSIGASFSSGTDQAFTGRGVALRPFSPVDVTLTDLPGGDISITWIRRNRLGQELRDGVEIFMSEASELYEVDIYQRADALVPLRTLSSATPAATYTLAQQVLDFGSPAATAETIAVAVYQLSNVVGRGVPAYEPPEAFPLDLDDDLAAEPGLSSSIEYLEYVKSDYPDSVAFGRTLEYRHRNSGGGFVVDAQLFGAANTVLYRFEDGETVASGGAGALYVNALVADPDPRYFYISQLYGGATLTGSGPGIVRKIDADAFFPGAVIASVTALSASGVGSSGDPQSLAVLGDHLYAACPFANTIVKFRRSDLAIVATLSPAYGAWTIYARGTELWAVERSRPSPRLWRVDTETGAALAVFTLTDGYPLDMVIAGDFAYLVSIDSQELVKYSVIDGARQPFTLDLSGEGFSSLRNYLTLDGARLSVGRAPVVYVIDTATDTQLAP
jgi:hypothetical protein